MRQHALRSLAAISFVTFFAAACSPQDSGDGTGEGMADNPCAANPCAANPCGGGQEMIDAALVTQGDRSLYEGNRAQLVRAGEALWSDASLSSSGSTSCATCHVNNYGMMKATFASPYPHSVAMAKDRAGLDEVNAAEMVQLCMVIPMDADPLAWDSQELAALTAYVEDIQDGFTADMAAPANPCAANPCAANPCAANPCASN